jgi:tetratricopeptide (TPR) repeat protein
VFCHACGIAMTAREGLMYRTAPCIVATLLAFVLAAPALAADDRKVCGEGWQTDKAIEACNRLMFSGGRRLQDRELAVIYSNRGEAWRWKGDWDNAIDDQTEALRRDPGHAKAFEGRGWALTGKAEHDRAVADFNELVRLKPTQSSLTARAEAHYNKGNFDWALADLDKAAELGPEQFGIYNLRGLVWRFRGEFDQAIAQFDKAFAFAKPKTNHQAFAYANRCAALRAKGDLDRALADCEKAVNTFGAGGYTLAHRCAVWLDRNEPDRAIEDCSDAIRRNARLSGAHARRALAYERKGDIQRARTDYAAALALPPVTPETRKDQEMVQRRLAVMLSSAPAQPTREAQAGPSAVAAAPVPATTPMPAATPADQGRRVALVIGNSAYKSVPALPNPKRDAGAVAAALRNIGFQTVTLEADLPREKLIGALKSFTRESEKADWSLVYYAGHGIEVSGVNYLIPVDARLESDRDIGFETIPLDHVLAAVEGAKRLRLVLVDACRDNPFASQMRRTIATRSIGRGLAAVEPEAGTLVVYAAKHGEAALDGQGDNSPFATALVRNLTKPGLEVRRLFDIVRDDVMEATSRRQQPFSYGSVPGRQDFFFVAR